MKTAPSPKNCFNFLISFQGKLPSPRSDHVATTDWSGKDVIVFGGGSHANCFNEILKFEVSQPKWKTMSAPTMVPSPRAGHSSAVLGSRVKNVMIYIQSGCSVFGLKFVFKSHIILRVFESAVVHMWRRKQCPGPVRSACSGHLHVCLALDSVGRRWWCCCQDCCWRGRSDAFIDWPSKWPVFWYLDCIWGLQWSLQVALFKRQTFHVYKLYNVGSISFSRFSSPSYNHAIGCHFHNYSLILKRCVLCKAVTKFTFWKSWKECHWNRITKRS